MFKCQFVDYDFFNLILLLGKNHKEMKLFKIIPVIIYFWAAIIIISCGPKTTHKEEEIIPEIYNAAMPETMQNGIDAIGGIEKWNSFGTLSYDLKSSWSEDHHMIDLKSRNLLISCEKYNIGFDGKEVWVMPSLDSIKRARFYSSLFFYFLSIPYVFNDDGVIYEDLGEKVMVGNKYKAVKISYESGTGDADKDEYIAHFNPNNHEMEWLLYTVTYGKGEKEEKFNALNYSGWNDVNGIKMPSKLVGYVFENDTIGKQRYEASFSNLALTAERPDPENFKMPDGAFIDTLKTN